MASYDRVFAADKCTAIVVGKDASTSGSPMTTHTADCAECDWRINKVPARDWPEGSMRPIYILTGAYPRQVREDRGYTWSKANLENMPQKSEWEKQEGAYIIGYIPQVAHTYALIEGMYGIMNEHHVSIGESTCAARFFAAPVVAGGKALLEVSELSQIALERAKTAREAIQIMGDLAMKYGYYSAEWDVSKYGEAYAMGEGGEALTVIDKTEAWMFHILPDDTGSQAIWVAQRVPDSHISVVANSFVIREVFPNRDDFMYSPNLWSIAKKHGWWSEKDNIPLNFLKVYAPQRYHPNYSNRRVWRVLSLSNPTLKLSPESDAYADNYPFSVPVERAEKTKYSPRDIMNLQRDHYEGTPFSTAEGLAAGPYGDPNRFDLWSNGNMTVWDANEGEFPRTISLFRTSYSFVAEPRVFGDESFENKIGKLWISQYAPDISTYTPIYIQSDSLPPSWIKGTMHKYDSNSAFWNFCLIGNYASRFYSYTISHIRKIQSKFEISNYNQLSQLENSWYQEYKSSNGNNLNQIKTEINQITLSKGEDISKEYADFFPQLVTQFRDGYYISNLNETSVKINRLFYPKWWLEKVGFFDIPGNKQGILFASNPENHSFNVNTLYLILLFICIPLSFFLGMKFKSSSTKKISPKKNIVSNEAELVPFNILHNTQNEFSYKSLSKIDSVI